MSIEKAFVVEAYSRTNEGALYLLVSQDEEDLIFTDISPSPHEELFQISKEDLKTLAEELC